jgi:hypothetical protein
LQRIPRMDAGHGPARRRKPNDVRRPRERARSK